MQRRLNRCAAAILVALAAHQPHCAWAAGPPHGGDCLSGNCVNGIGTVRRTDGTFTGPWSQGQFTAGEYLVRYTAFPQEEYALKLDADGFPLAGTVVRRSGSTMDGRMARYTGSFKRVWHPIKRAYVLRYDQGSYVSPNGYVFEGQFDFIPTGTDRTLSMGYYIFQGVRIDEQLDEVRPGLFISEITTSEGAVDDFLASLPVQFFRGTPDYLVKLQQDLENDIAKVDAAEATKRAQERASRETWKNVLGVTLGAIAVVGVAHYASRSQPGPATTAIGDTLRGARKPEEATAATIADLRERAKTSPELARKIGNADDKQLAQMLQGASTSATRPMTRAEYEGLKKQSTVAAAQSPTEPVRARPVVSAPVPTSAAPQSPAVSAAAPRTASENQPKAKPAVELGPVLPEMLAICHQGKSKGWACYGSLDNQVIFDEPTLESALGRQHCAGGTWAAGGPTINGVSWDAYRCNKSLGAGDYDVAKRYQMTTARRSYQCPKGTPSDGRCTIYYGQAAE